MNMRKQNCMLPKNNFSIQFPILNLYSAIHGILGRMSDYYKVKNFLLKILGDYKITESNFVIYGFCLAKKSEGPSREKLDSRKVTRFVQRNH
jgi:hypothetical protein